MNADVPAPVSTMRSGVGEQGREEGLEARALAGRPVSPTAVHTSGCCAISRAVQAAPRDSSSAAASARESVRGHAVAPDDPPQAAM